MPIIIAAHAASTINAIREFSKSLFINFMKNATLPRKPLMQLKQTMNVNIAYIFFCFMLVDSSAGHTHSHVKTRLVVSSGFISDEIGRADDFIYSNYATKF